VRTLLRYKADTGIRDANNLSATDHALAGGNTNIASLLQPQVPKK